MSPLDVKAEVEAVIGRVDHYLSRLPDPLGSMGKEFIEKGFPYRVAFTHNPLGFPGLHLPFWLAETNHVDETSESFLDQARESVDAALLGYLYIRIQDDVYDFKKGHDPSWLLLANELIARCFRTYQELFPAASSFWKYFWNAWLEFSQATALEIKTCRGSLKVPREKDLSLIGQKLAFAKVPVSAILLKAGKEETLPLVYQMVELLATSSQLLNDLYSIPRDLATKHFTYPFVSALEKHDLGNGEDVEHVLFQRFLEKSSVEDLLNHVVDLDRKVLVLLESYPIPGLLAFLKARMGLVHEIKVKYIRMKLESLVSL